MIARALGRCAAARTAVGAVAVAVAVALSAWGAVGALVAPPAAAVPCQPLPPLIVCTPPDQPSPPPTTAALSIDNVAATGPTTAQLSATINPDGAITTYQWVLTDHDRHAPEVDSPPAALPAVRTAQSVATTLTGLQPGTAYDVQLQATSSAGPVSSAASLTTPQNAHVTLAAPHPDSVPLGALKVTATGRVTGVVSRYAPVQLEVATAPFTTWRLIDGVVPRADGSAALSACPDRSTQNACPWMQRNFALRAVDGNAHSTVRHVSVDPLVDLSVSRERNGASPWLDATLAASVHPLHGHFRSQPVYFYEASRARGTYALVRTGRFRVQDQTTLVATARIHQPTAGSTVACYKRRLLPDMGFPGARRGCGARTLR